MNEPPTIAAASSASAHEDRDRALFEQIAKDYSRKDLAPASSRARRQRLRRTLAGLPVAGADVLEAGCGAGFSVRYLSDRPRSYIGIDYSENLVRYAHGHNARDGATFDVANIKTYQPPRPVDVVFMIGVLHHLDDMEAALRNMLGWLRPGGWLAINEPQSGNPLVQWVRRLRTRVDAGYSSDQEQLSARQLREMYVRAGFAEVQIRPQGVFSTPFGEVVMGPQWFTRPLAEVACLADTALEVVARGLLRRVSWNLIALGRRLNQAT
jgi:2-polyprenyl-3-methyl-5-hydroxy-6-metoxy-1,4-benzoquinol methylase